MSKLYQKLCNSIDYKIYYHIENSLLFSGVTTTVCNNVLKIIMNPEVNSLDFVSLILLLSYFSLKDSDGRYYTRDVKEIKLLYQEFITNYNKMNKTFGFNEPISIYTMFNYLIGHGYLSKDKTFRIQNNSYTSLSWLSGADVINGSGVCRHIASMLTDILNDYKINACNVTCYSVGDCLEESFVDKKRYSREKNISLINKYIFNDKDKEEMISKLDELSEASIYVQLRLVRAMNDNSSMRIFGNHLITYSLHDNKSYYLDPTNASIFRLSNYRKGVLYNSAGTVLNITKASFGIHNDVDGCKMKKDIMMPCQCVSYEEEQEIILSTMDVCENNLGIFEEFYRENSELYSDISNKLTRVRKTVRR